MKQLEQQALSVAQRIFPCEVELCDKVPIDKISGQFLSGILSQERPFLIRLAGQSGSGKSSQLLPSVLSALSSVNYVQFNVGKFAPFHPQYHQWMMDCPHLMREKTNGFALRALIMFYTICLIKRVNVVLDMTLIEPEIEQYLYTLAKKQGYCIQTHILGVPKYISDTFIIRRQAQTKRCVFKEIADYFFQVLPRAIKALQTMDIFDKNDLLIIWSHRQAGPVKITTHNNKSTSRLLQFLRQNRWRQIKDKTALLKSKKYWFKLLVKRLPDT